MRGIWFYQVGLVSVWLPGKKVESVWHTRQFFSRFLEEVLISVEHGAVETKNSVSNNIEEVVSQETVPVEIEEYNLETVPI